MTTRRARGTGWHVADGTLVALLSEGLALPLAWITVTYLARRLGPETFGLYTLAGVLVSWVAWSTASQVSPSTIKLVSEARSWRSVASTALRIHLALGLAAAVGFLAGADLIATLLREPKLAIYLRVLSIEFVIFAAVRAHGSIAIGRGLFRRRAAAQATFWVTRLVMIVLLVEAGFSVIGVIAARILANAAELVVYRLAVRPAIFEETALPARRFLSFAAPVMVLALCRLIFMRLDLFALKVLGGTAAQAGFYGAAQTLAVVPSLAVRSFIPLFLSGVGQLRQAGQHDAARGMVRNALRMVLFMAPFVTMTAGLADEIVGLLFGVAFAPTATPLALLVLSQVAMALLAVTTTILISLDRSRSIVLFGLLIITAGAVGHLVVIPARGALGAASVTAGVAVVAAMIGLRVLHRVIGVAAPLPTVLRTAGLAIVAYVVAASWVTPGPWVLGKIVAIGLLILAGYVATGELTRDELRFTLSLVRRSREPPDRS